MTLVDLPGITRVPVGDHPPDIVQERIQILILSYIKRDSIASSLSVSPANSDLANSDALTLSRMVDPDGKRTIGVITKLDIMDRGTESCAYLRGEVVPLRLGYVGVVNRCQQDIAQRRSIREARASEMEFFRQHPAYVELPNCGTEALGWTVSRICPDHIARLLPELQDKISRRKSEAQRELSSLGDGRPEDPASQAAMVLEKLHGYAASFTKSVAGKNEDLKRRRSRRGSYSFRPAGHLRQGSREPRPDPGDVRGRHPHGDSERCGHQSGAPAAGGALREPCQAGDSEDVGSMPEVREAGADELGRIAEATHRRAGSAAIPAPGAVHRGRDA